jgi:prolyl-tRNA editing enzyme YbaK/EbsC (Cys-tRNA(Pro) deacylase)
MAEVDVDLEGCAMIPGPVEEHLCECHPGFEHHLHRTAWSGQALAAAEHVSGYAVAKPVIARIGGEPFMLVVSAAQRVDVAALEGATGKRVELVPEWEFVEWFPACEQGAEPPFAIFGLPIIADLALALRDRVLMPAGTHDDSVVLDTSRWIDCEDVQAMPGLGAPLH